MEEHKGIQAAFIAAYNEIQTQSFTKDSDGHNGYKYMSFDALLGIVKPILLKHGLIMIQPVSSIVIEGVVFIQCTTEFWGYDDKLSFAGNMPYEKLKGMTSHQSAGSGFTHMKRYHCCGIFGITIDVDNDGYHGNDNRYDKPPQTNAKQPPRGQNDKVIANDQEVIEAINNSPLEQSKKENLITQYKSKPNSIKTQFFKSFILPQIKGDK